MLLKRLISPWFCVLIFASSGCSHGNYALRSDNIKITPQTATHGKESYTEEDPFEKETPSVECFENGDAIKKAYERLEKARDSFLAALSLPSFSFFILENSKTSEQKTVFTENHSLPPPFNNEKEWRVTKEAPAGIKTIVICALMLELQKF